MYGGFYLLYDEQQENERDKDADDDEYVSPSALCPVLLLVCMTSLTCCCVGNEAGVAVVTPPPRPVPIQVLLVQRARTMRTIRIVRKGGVELGLARSGGWRVVYRCCWLNEGAGSAVPAVCDD